MKAKNLRSALNILDPERSLRTDAELRDFFVARPMYDVHPSIAPLLAEGE